ncbi:MAG TPA: class I SAM-dependent methyltransferase [Thermoanaerobaculia bacterium]
MKLLDYRDFYYPLNVLLHVLTLEEGEVRHLHYGLFERDDEPIAAAQERASAKILAQLPPPPARVLDVGSGLGANLDRLKKLGYDALGITPDANQIEAIRARYGDLPLQCMRFEDIREKFDVAMFHESSQYIDSEALFAKAEEVTPRVLVLDEFAFGDVEGLHRYDEFIAAAKRHGFELLRDEDVSKAAAPTVPYFMKRIPKYRRRIVEDLGVSDAQVDALIASGERYSSNYHSGRYGYRLLVFGWGSHLSFCAISTSGRERQMPAGARFSGFPLDNDSLYKMENVSIRKGLTP